MKPLLTILFIFTTLTSNPLWAEEGRLVEIKELEFRIHKPVTWHFFQELHEPLEHTPPTLESLLFHYTKNPVVAISKFPAEYAQDINPNIRVTLKPVKNTIKKNGVASKDPEQLLRGILTSLKPVLLNMKIDEDVQVLTISGHHAAFARMSYTMRLTDGRQPRGNSDMWLVMPRSDYAFLISGVTREDQHNANREDLREIVKTIKLSALTYDK